MKAFEPVEDFSNRSRWPKEYRGIKDKSESIHVNENGDVLLSGHGRAEDLKLSAKPTATTPKKRPRDPIQLAKLIGDIATRQVEDKTEDSRDPAAVALGRKGGLAGGKARAKSLSPEQRSEIAKKAAAKRWGR